MYRAVSGTMAIAAAVLERGKRVCAVAANGAFYAVDVFDRDAAGANSHSEGEAIIFAFYSRR
jgi:hypothetical protein